jgi:hypothetical protein
MRCRPIGNLFAVLPYLANERDSAPRIVERDVVADLLQVNFGLWCEVRAHSLRAFFGHFGVLAFQTVKHLGSGFRFAAAATPFDFATQTVDYRLATLLIFFQKSQPIPNNPSQYLCKDLCERLPIVSFPSRSQALRLALWKARMVKDDLAPG